MSDDDPIAEDCLAGIDRQVQAGLAAVHAQVRVAKDRLEARFADLRLREAGVPTDAEVEAAMKPEESTDE
jgi:hypothetical protein